MSTFAELPLDERLLTAVANQGYTEPTPIQAEAIPRMVSGQDIIAGARTGSGKTAAFALPLLERIKDGGGKVRGLILCPTRELAMQVGKNLQAYGAELPIRGITVYGGASYTPQLKALRSGVDVVVGTPGRVLDHLKRGSLDLSALEVFVLDEADEMLRMGFIDDVEAILGAAPETRQVALFSATMPAPIRRIADNYLKDPQEVAVESRAMTVDHIEQRAISVGQNHKLEALVRVLQVMPGVTHLVFTRTRLQAAEVAGELSRRGIAADAIHGDLAQPARERVLGRMRAKRLQVLVATDVAARGLDVNHIGHVVNMDVPADIESYVHRIGRTGRAGREGRATVMVTRREQFRLRRLEKTLKVQIRKVRVPTDADIARRQLDRLQSDLENAENLDPARVVVQELLERTELSETELAARALAMLAEHTNLRLDSGSDEAPEWSRPPRTDGDMVEIFMPIGRNHDLRPGDIVGALGNECGVPGNAIGRISIFPNKTFVQLPKGTAEDVLDRFSRLDLRGNTVPLSMARPRSEGPPKHRPRPPWKKKFRPRR